MRATPQLGVPAMKHRSPIAVLLLPFITFGINSWYWIVKTKGEMNRRGAKIPTAWIWLIPIVGGIYWLVKYSQGVELISGGRCSSALAFVFLFVLGVIGHALVQATFNEVQ